MKHPTILPNGKIDIHHFERQYAAVKDKISSNSTLFNKDVILQYLRDSELGKTIKKGQKKKVGIARNLKVAGVLLLADKQWFHEPFKDVTVQEMENFVLALDNGEIKSNRGTPYKSESIMGIKKILRKFWKYLKGNSQFYPQEVEWIDTTGEQADIKALPDLKDSVDKMVELAPTILKKAIIMTLFDSGCREGELLNVRIKDVEPLSKEDDTLVLRVRYSKTFGRPVSVPYGTYYLKRWLAEHPEKDNPEAQVFPLSKQSFYLFIQRLGKKALNMKVFPHMFRHTSATFYASRLDRATFCKRFGWSFSSNVPDRYLDWAKISEKKTVETVKIDEISKIRYENEDLKQKIVSIEERMKKQAEILQGTNDLMIRLLQDENLKKTIVQTITQQGLQNQVKEILRKQ